MSAAPAAPPARLRVARAAADGYTLGLRPRRHPRRGAGRSIPNLAYDPEKDFEPIGLIAEQPELLDGPQGFPGQQPARNSSPTPRPTSASSTWGTPASARCPISAACCSTTAIGIKPTLVPFTGTAPVMNAILAGQVDYDCDPVLGPLPHVRAGTAEGAGHRHQQAQPAAAGRADVGRAGPAGVRLRAVLCGVRAQGHAEGRSSTSSRTRSTRASTMSRPQAPDRSRRRDRRAEGSRPEGAGGAGEERGRAAHADPEGRGGEVRRSVIRASPSATRIHPADHVMPLRRQPLRFPE